MREIRFLGLCKRKNDNRNHPYSIFECQLCKSWVEKKTRDGIKSKFCSHGCYAKKRTKRGAYKDFVIISGYKYVMHLDHPMRTKKGYVAEHRLIAEKKINRYSTNNEDVHHINENKLDNRPENLMVLTKSEHMKLHKNITKRDSNGKFTTQV